MVDDLRPDGSGRFERPTTPAQPGSSSLTRRGRRADMESRRVVDREVPISRPEPEQRMLSTSVHAWLDGDLPEASVRNGEMLRDVAFWNRINLQVERRRHTRTPVELQQRIMDALPHGVPQLITPWWKREFVVTPGAALTAAGVLVSLTVLITSLVLAAAG
jgi:hypothetical protein